MNAITLGVDCFIIRGGRMLLVRAADSGRVDSWDVPVARMLGGEAPVDTAGRELLETTGLTMTSATVFASFTNVDIEGRLQLLLVRTTGEVEPNAHSVRWFDIDALPDRLGRTVCHGLGEMGLLT